jgi:hypothetical protein
MKMNTTPPKKYKPTLKRNLGSKFHSEINSGTKM